MKRAGSSWLGCVAFGLSALLVAQTGCEDSRKTEAAPAESPSAKPPELEVVPAALPKAPEMGTLPLPAMSAAELPKAGASAAPTNEKAPAAADTQAAGAKTKEPPQALRKDPKSPGPLAPRGAATQ